MFTSSGKIIFKKVTSLVVLLLQEHLWVIITLRVEEVGNKMKC